MNEEIDQTDFPTPGEVNLCPTIGCFGLILFPIAIVLYLIALPFVGALWVLEFFLPRHPWEMPIDEPTLEAPVEIPEHGLKDLKPH